MKPGEIWFNESIGPFIVIHRPVCLSYQDYDDCEETFYYSQRRRGFLQTFTPDLYKDIKNGWLCLHTWGLELRIWNGSTLHKLKRQKDLVKLV